MSTQLKTVERMLDIQSGLLIALRTEMTDETNSPALRTQLKHTVGTGLLMLTALEDVLDEVGS